MRWTLGIALLLGCAGDCGACGRSEPAPRARRAEPTAPAEPLEPPVDPCLDADAELEGFAEGAPLALDAVPTGYGGEPLDEAVTLVWIADEVVVGDDDMGPPEDAATAISDRDPIGGRVALVLRADDPVRRVAPVLSAFPETQELALVLIETERAAPGCRRLRMLTFGRHRGETHSWVAFPLGRPVRDLVVALGGAEIPRRVQFLE